MTEEKKEAENKSPETSKEKVVNYELSVLELLKNGVHFGHKKSTRNPKMNPYIFGVRKGVNIINLEKTAEKFQESLNFLEQLIEKNGEVILVGTKKQAKNLIREIAEEIKMPYVNERWIGGTFTNFKVISSRVNYYKNQKRLLEQGQLDHLTKFEKNKLNKELNKLESQMGGLIEMKRLPEAVFVLDIDKDRTAIKEAQKKGIKTIALVDTNDDPEGLDYFIPANNDALSSLGYVLGVVADKIKKVQKVNINKK
jgi:small subunit ribosomal protein S2